MDTSSRSTIFTLRRPMTCRTVDADPIRSGFHRQFIYVDNAAKVLVMAFERPNLPRNTYDVTGDSYLTFPEIAETVRKVFTSAEISIAEGDDPVDDRQTRFDIAAARRDIGFSPRISLADGIGPYAEWLRQKSKAED